jgi:hypothetical protein
VPALRTGDPRAFQFRVDIEMMADQAVAYVSWAPPDRRCLIVSDRVDGLPLLIAVDGRAWVYDLIGGQIVRIRAEPSVLARIRGDVLQLRWGIRADFPDEDSRTTIDVDLGGVMRELGRQTPGALKVTERPPAAWFDAKGTEAILEVGEKDASPAAFFLRSRDARQRMTVRFDGFAFAGKTPPWHRPVDEAGWPEQLALAAVADVETLPADARDRLKAFQQLLNGGGLFILRPALRDPELQRSIERNSPVKLDFTAIRANDEKLRDAWRKVLHEQQFDLPDLAPASKPSPAETK